MRFSDRLQTLMSIYRLSNITLARGIGADPSLVSRWKSGERVPKSNSQVYSDIAVFLSGRGMLKHDRETLVKLLESPCDTREAAKIALMAWLKGKPVFNAVNLTPEEPELVRDMFGHLTNVFSDAARAPAGPVNLYPRVQRGYFGDHERFDGVTGMRQAVINFFHTVMLCRTPGDLYLMPPEDNEWLNGDSAFENLYTNSLRAIIQAGHTIHMVHPEPHGSSLGPLLSTYMPLYTTGRFVSYGRTVSESTSPAVFALQGQAAVVSYYSAEQTSTLYFKSQKDILPFVSIVLSQLKNSSPLAAACLREAPLSLAERLIQLEDKPGALFGVKNTLDPLFLPEKMVYSLLSSQLPQNRIDPCLDMLARRRELLLQRLDSQPWITFLPYSVIDAIQINGTCRLSGVELLTPKDVTLSGDDLREFLNGILDILDKYPLTVIAFTEDCPPINLTVKEGSGTIFMADSAESQPSAVYVGDLTLCEALVRWFTARTIDMSEAGRRKTAELIDEAINML